MHDIPLLHDYCLFILCSVGGWIIESSFRTIVEQRGFINSGFLRGPVIPIYGIGALLISIVDGYLGNIPFMVKAIVLTVLCIALEYLVGFLFEKILGLKLWDYSKKLFNIHGRICLPYSFAWLLLVTVFVKMIHPNLDRFVSIMLNKQTSLWLIGVSGAVLIIDIVFSFHDTIMTIRSLKNFRMRRGNILYESFCKLALWPRRRVLSAFPYLIDDFVRNFERTIIDDFAPDASKGNLSKAADALKKHPADIDEIHDKDFIALIHEMAMHPEVRKMANYRHHDDTTLRHSLTVALVSFYMAKAFNLDRSSVAKGALLHDFFLYDWHDGEKRRHATRHASRALRNAKACFSLNTIEEDIILTHMWPIGRPFYSSREAFLVSTVDKIVSAKETVAVLKQVNRRIEDSFSKEISRTLKRRKVWRRIVHLEKAGGEV